MCNLYVMYYSLNAKYEQCFDEQSVAISEKLPLDSDFPPARNMALESAVAGIRWKIANIVWNGHTE